jgi:hypothetical protein
MKPKATKQDRKQAPMKGNAQSKPNKTVRDGSAPQVAKILKLDERPPGPTDEAAIAFGVVRGVMMEAFVIDKYTSIKSSAGAAPGINEYLSILHEIVKQVNNNDLTAIEVKLIGQAFALSAVFDDMVMKASQCARMDQLELFMRLALKAQNQSRSTLQALAEIKRPMHTVFAGQANFSNGPQQINNGAQQSGAESREFQKNTESLKNKLSDPYEQKEKLDTPAAGEASRCGQELATMGAIHRPENESWQGQIVQECR